MSKVLILPVITRFDVPAERILNTALDKKLKSVVVVGYDEDDREYFASSIADGANVLWLLERCKKKLLETVEDEEGV